MRRFYFDNIDDNCADGRSADGRSNEVVSIPKEQQNHLFRVLRMKQGDTLEISNGTGMIFTGEIISEDCIKIIDIKQGTEKPLLATAFLAEIKAMDEAISILAEHGIQRIIPFFASRSISKFDPKQALKKQERRQKLVDESIKKVGGLYKAEITPSIPFGEIPKYLDSQKIVFYESENSPSQKLSSIDYSQELSFFIGAEGGFTDKEIQTLHEWGCQNYSLGTRILRATQACASASTLIRYFTENCPSSTFGRF